MWKLPNVKVHRARAINLSRSRSICCAGSGATASSAVLMTRDTRFRPTPCPEGKRISRVTTVPYSTPTEQFSSRHSALPQCATRCRSWRCRRRALVRNWLGKPGLRACPIPQCVDRCALSRRSSESGQPLPAAGRTLLSRDGHAHREARQNPATPTTHVVTASMLATRLRHRCCCGRRFRPEPPNVKVHRARATAPTEARSRCCAGSGATAS